MKTGWSLSVSCLLVATAFVLIPPAAAQISHGGTPFSFSHDVRQKVPTAMLPPVNVEALLAEEAAERERGGPFPFTYGTPRDVEIRMDNDGIWESLSDGGRLWRVRIHSMGAYSTNLVYSDFYIPPGAPFFVYDPNRTAAGRLLLRI